jgi:molecular chaperone DnaK (HSP70)
VYPLRLGEVAGAENPYLVPTALLFAERKLWLGPSALANADEVGSEPVLSFKRLLGARDFDQVLDLRLPRSESPDENVSNGDALALYLAYLLAVTSTAMRQESELPTDALFAERRYCHPMWRPGLRAHSNMSLLFDVASKACETLQHDLLNPNGLDVMAALDAIGMGRQRPGHARIQTGVFEARAAAECHMLDASNAMSYLMVFDMGAGTSDIAVFQRDLERGEYHELPHLRRTTSLAGDAIDELLIAAIGQQAKGERKPGAEQRFWKRLRVRARSLKQTLFTSGKVRIAYEGREIRLKLRDFLSTRDFRDFRAALDSEFRETLFSLAEIAPAKKSTKVGVILAGGGANLPFLDELVRNVQTKKGIVLQPLPVRPQWTEHPVFGGQLAPVFPQMSVSIGGALSDLSAQLELQARLTATIRTY